MSKPGDSNQKRGLLGWLWPARKETDAPASDQSRYRDDGELARGGMSSVREVVDNELLRPVAMKVLDEAHNRQSRHRRRFREEARVTAQLEHPNIVPVHDLGRTPGGTPFITMKLVRGDDLATLIDREPEGARSPERLRFYLEVLVKVCDALAFAHSRGVLHRDLKPANIMVGEYGQVYLMDWGLATVRGEVADDGEPIRIAEGSSLRATQEGEAVGTLEYLSPEQAFGRSSALDERTDVFGLGAVLYHVLTGRPPYDGEIAVDLITKARDARFVPVDQLVEAPGGLVDVCHRAMALDPADRFESVTAFEDELRALLRGGLHLPQRIFPAGAAIISEGDEGTEAFLVVEGTCELFRGDKMRRQLGPGDVFGEVAALGGERRTATVKAKTQVRTLVVTREALLEELGFDRFAGSFVRALAQRFMEVVEEDAQGGG